MLFDLPYRYELVSWHAAEGRSVAGRAYDSKGGAVRFAIRFGPADDEWPEHFSGFKFPGRNPPTGVGGYYGDSRWWFEWQEVPVRPFPKRSRFPWEMEAALCSRTPEACEGV
jgi:hypothetical protein